MIMSMAITKKVAFTQALQSRPFALVWSGQTISSLGDGAFTTALAWEVLQLTGSATVMSLVMMMQILPSIVFLLVGGVVADRLPKRQVMLSADASRAVAVLLIAILGVTHLVHMWHLVVLALFFGTVRGFFTPAYQSIVPQLVEKEHLSSANSLTEMSYNCYISLGPMVGAACVALTGPAGAFALDGLTFLISACCLMALRLPVSAMAPATTSKPEPSQGLRSVCTDVREGLCYVASSTFLWVTILVIAFGSMGSAGALIVALPKLIHDVYGQGVWLLGALGMASGVGSMVGIFITGKLSRLDKRGWIMNIMLAIPGVAMLVMGLPLSHAAAPIVACIAMALTDFGFAIAQILWVTLMQEMVPGDKLGRVSSIDQLGTFSLWPVGYVLAGLMADRMSPSLAFIGAGALNLALCGMALSVREIRHME
jgi:MFS family permease